jgi:MOSC domain-containing protein YiiM
MASQMPVKAIFISAERDGQIRSISEAMLIAGKGIEGDRYFEDKNRPSPDYEISFIESEKVDEYNSSNPNKIEYWKPRRNILTTGVNLNALVGKNFRINECIFEGIVLCEPCALFEKRTHPKAMKWFEKKGGLRAKIIQGGRIKVGDEFKS